MHDWEIESSPEVDAFIVDNVGLVDDLIDAIETLKLTEGLPDIGQWKSSQICFTG
jgi:hypothetical protein